MQKKKFQKLFSLEDFLTFVQNQKGAWTKIPYLEVLNIMWPKQPEPLRWQMVRYFV